jgi:hypothetical protein
MSGMIEAAFFGMNTPESCSIASQLKTKGFSLRFDRVCYAPERPQWCAQAYRGGREWRSFGEDLNSAFAELRKQTLDRETDEQEMATSNASRSAGMDASESIVRFWGIND